MQAVLVDRGGGRPVDQVIRSLAELPARLARSW